MSSRYFIIYISIAFIAYWLLNPFYSSINQHEEKVEDLRVDIDSTFTVSFSAVGDIMCHSTQYNYAWIKKDSFDFDPVFRYVKKFLVEKDILIGNLETVLAGDTKNWVLLGVDLGVEIMRWEKRREDGLNL